jgi:bifunctional non-homologous end joining protein LigD
VNDLPTLLWVANLASIELHSSLSLASSDLQPTAVVFDLDPGAPAGLRECCKVALWTRELLENFGLQTVIKTSGLKGLQVYLPLNSEVSYEDTKPFAHALARLLEREHPEIVLSRMNRKLRAGKVLIDWSQNDQHKTTVCAYSLRALERPRVSTPLSWEEVERGARSRKEPMLSDDPKALVRRLEKHGDPFQAAISLRQKLPDFAAKALSGQESRSEPQQRLTRRELYERARELDVVGRSKMTGAQLRGAIARVEKE